MIVNRWFQFREWMLRCFPERHLYLRSGGEMRTFTLSSRRQIGFAGLTAAVLGWTLISTAAVGLNALALNAGDEAAARTKAYYERLIADRQARLNSAVAELTQTSGSLDGLAQSIGKRHAALAMLLADVRGVPGAAATLEPITQAKLEGRSPVDKIQTVRADQERLVAAAEGFAHSRADRLRLAFRLAGLDPAAFSGRAVAGESLGGPLIEAKDPSALAAILDVDEGFAARIQSAAQDLNAMRSLGAAIQTLPLQKPVSSPVRSSGFGVRFDPFTGRPAFHAGQDFSGAYMTPIYSTAPGVVSFTGVRSGYGNTVEIDHGKGFKTRYAHLEGISVAPGQRVGVGQRIGAMGSTGRSTGTHLHYEVWENGRVQDPTRFLKAGDYVQQAG
ncbi:MAG TPA: peptidoglycan DD-metalloendopeptidase family protein [Caulobacteraceae bacterium]|jgi:murein DD-endopeptidase MepM/ murein hydrolase activator NlpD|nr:peptidoglycan DD-metalloendopeptidase family protein [Caulobacteraceae bacterium]